MDIPIQNIYYLLIYAWNKLEESKIVSVDKLESNRIIDLFARVLSNGMKYIMRRGLDRGYILHAELTGSLKGRIDFNSSMKPILRRKPELFCEYDEMSYNVLHNQIVRTTINRVLKVKALDESIRKDLDFIERRLRHISLIPLAKKHFSLVQLHRNNFFYDFLLRVCELIYDNLLISKEKGTAKFRDFIKDEKAMRRVFEEFVRNFFRLEQSQYHVGSEIINWQAQAIGETSMDYLPEMRTDVSLTSRNRKIIIDTKYYREVFQEYKGKKTIRSGHLYQLYAYLEYFEHDNSEREAPCEGVLLYPTTDQELNLQYKIKEHFVSIRTINLNQDWNKIHKSLLQIIN